MIKEHKVEGERVISQEWQFIEKKEMVCCLPRLTVNLSSLLSEETNYLPLKRTSKNATTHFRSGKNIDQFLL